MSTPTHPRDVLFAGEKPFPALPAVDHYAGSEKLMRKALALQQELGPVFDLTCDCEDGARAGAEAGHAQMVVEIVNGADNRFGRVGARIHDITHPHWERDLEILVGGAGPRLAFITLPKVRSATDTAAQIARLRHIEAAAGVPRPLPVHVLIETHGALREVWRIAAQDGVESLDFGLMDFVSGHHGAIPGAAMKSPGQFEHPLIVRAKTEISAAALACGVVPSHNVTTELKDVDFIRRDAERARREFGYLRMWSIHPNQILPIVEAMRPDFSEVEEATEILAAAQDVAWGPIQHGGRLHDRASYRYYWELLQRAQQTGMALPQAARSRFFAN
ncbi:HpcH/HpaI aldolase/citrate lyase family protein [Thauera sinica]|uniref:HpcH/HpaI aldolase/citrate lyase family protein n=1 Tax=Thauera sinica TaxID=2665146 RepID=A0ABW1AQ61_9RHOO|nr:aldolase/citrate lyase family protein [Thauera sp. K11]ATE59627.1 CoA ester lyase [Thauera sp. K11]